MIMRLIELRIHTLYHVFTGAYSVFCTCAGRTCSVPVRRHGVNDAHRALRGRRFRDACAPRVSPHNAATRSVRPARRRGVRRTPLPTGGHLHVRRPGHQRMPADFRLLILLMMHAAATYMHFTCTSVIVLLEYMCTFVGGGWSHVDRSFRRLNHLHEHLQHGCPTRHWQRTLLRIIYPTINIPVCIVHSGENRTSNHNMQFNFPTVVSLVSFYLFGLPIAVVLSRRWSTYLRATGARSSMNKRPQKKRKRPTNYSEPNSRKASIAKARSSHLRTRYSRSLFCCNVNPFKSEFISLVSFREGKVLSRLWIKVWCSRAATIY